MGCCAKRIRVWRRRFLDEGRQGLADRPRSGRPPALGADARALLETALVSSPLDSGYPVTVWTVADLTDLLGRHGWQVCATTVWRTLHTLGYGYRRPRHSLTHRQDAEAVAAAKHVLSELHRYMAVQRHGALRVITRWRKRRVSVSSPRHDNRGPDPIDIAVVPPRRVSGRSQRTAYHTPRQPKLSPGQQAIIRSEAGNRTLRELAAAFGVSHETIRTVLKKTSGNVLDAMT